jgi:hypothetical protein
MKPKSTSSLTLRLRAVITVAFASSALVQPAA